MAVTQLVGVKGMNDILPQESGRWQRLEEIVAGWARSYGYAQIRTPIVEPTALFSRGLGRVTDIVEKEMYSFEDSLNGEQLTLRPEMTAGVVRAVIEHNLLYDGPKRLWYMGPMFRHERPQRGRYRQFHQIGVEAMGFAGPDVDVEVIAMCQRLWDDLGLRDITLQYTLPERLIRNASLFVTGTDLLLFTNYSGLDPIVNGNTAAVGGSGAAGIDYGNFPMPRGINLGIRLTR